MAILKVKVAFTEKALAMSIHVEAVIYCQLFTLVVVFINEEALIAVGTLQCILSAVLAVLWAGLAFSTNNGKALLTVSASEILAVVDLILLFLAHMAILNATGGALHLHSFLPSTVFLEG